MDGVSNTIEIWYVITDVNVDEKSQDWQLKLRIVGDFEIKSAGRTLYFEKEFPIVEFAHQAASWVKRIENDFEYKSMESDIEPLIWFKCKDGKLLIGSAHQVYEEKKMFKAENLKTTISEFIIQLKTDLLSNYNIDISHLIA